MSDNFGGTFVSISDDEGNNYELEHLDTIAFEDKLYLAFVPADISEDDERYGMIILRSDEENGETILSDPEPEELQRVYEEFMRILFGDDETEE